jgi:hypothetical protein
MELYEHLGIDMLYRLKYNVLLILYFNVCIVDIISKVNAM